MMTKYWHWVGLVALIFACIYVWKQGYLKRVPVAGSYLSA